VTAVLERPDPLLVELSAPASNSRKPAVLAAAFFSPASWPLAANTAPQVWVDL